MNELCQKYEFAKLNDPLSQIIPFVPILDFLEL